MRRIDLILLFLSSLCGVSDGKVVFGESKRRALKRRKTAASFAASTIFHKAPQGEEEEGGGGHRKLSAQCDSAFNSCMNDYEGCFACVTDVLQFSGDDDLDLSDNAGALCSDVIKFLHSHSLCEDVKASSTAGMLMCDLWNDCADQVLEDDNYGPMYYYQAYYYREEDDGYQPEEPSEDKNHHCSVDACEVKNTVWLGDGRCDDDEPCYNTHACGWDGGDCCEATCVDTPSNNCGGADNKFVCRDPDNQGCGVRAKANALISKSSGKSTIYLYPTMSGTAEFVGIEEGTLFPDEEADDALSIDFCLPQGCYVVETETDFAGADPGSFSITLGQGDVLAQASAPAVCIFSVDSASESSSFNGYCDTKLAEFGLSGEGCFMPAQESQEDPSCPHSLEMVMKDEGYNGWDWNVDYVVTKAEPSSEDSPPVMRGSLGAGHMGIDSFCIEEPGCYEVTVENGFFSSEISWALGEQKVGVLARGSAPAKCSFAIGDVAKCENTCDDSSEEDLGKSCEGDENTKTYVVETYSTDSGGWKGDAMIKRDDEIVSSFRALTDQSQSVICLDPDVCYSLEFDAANSIAEDESASWAIGRASGSGKGDVDLVISGGASPSDGSIACFFSISGDACDAEAARKICAPAGRTTLPPTPSSSILCPEDTQLVNADLFDTWGDGWNGATISVFDVESPNEAIHTESLQEGEFASIPWCLPVGRCYVVKVQSGEWLEEVSWQLTTPQVNQNLLPMVITAGAAPEECGFTLPVEGSYMWSPDLELPVCNSGCRRVAEDDWDLPYEYYTYSVFGNDDEDPFYYSTYAGFIDDDLDDLCKGSSECDFIEASDGLQAVSDAISCMDTEAVDSYSLSDPFAAELWRGRPELCHDNYDWRELDAFEACAAEVAESEDPGIKSDECIRILASAVPENSNQDVSSDDLVKRLATVVYYYGDSFCECVSADTEVPTCGDFARFHSVLREAHEACDALDVVDCPYLGRYADRCMATLGGNDLDWTDQYTCRTIDTHGCTDDNGLPMTIPSVRRWDCLDSSNREMTGSQKSFIENVERYCEGGLEEVPENAKKSKSSKDTDSPSAGHTFLIVSLTFLVLLLAGSLGFWVYRRRTMGEAIFVPVGRQAPGDEQSGNELTYSFSPLSENPPNQGPAVA